MALYFLQERHCVGLSESLKIEGLQHLLRVLFLDLGSKLLDSRFTRRPASWFSSLERLASQIFLQTVALLTLIPQMRLWEFEIGLKRGSISNEMTKVLPSR